MLETGEAHLCGKVRRKLVRLEADAVIILANIILSGESENKDFHHANQGGQSLSTPGRCPSYFRFVPQVTVCSTEALTSQFLTVSFFLLT